MALRVFRWEGVGIGFGWVAHTQGTIGGRMKGCLFPNNFFWICKFSSVCDIFSSASICDKRIVPGTGVWSVFPVVTMPAQTVCHHLCWNHFYSLSRTAGAKDGCLLPLSLTSSHLKGHLSPFLAELGALATLQLPAWAMLL